MEHTIRWHAVAEAYEHHRERLMASLTRLYPSAAVEDALQDLFLRLARNGLGDPAVLNERYLWRCLNRAIRKRQALEGRRRCRLAERAQGDGADAVECEPNHACQASQAVADEALALALSALGSREMEVFRMLICQGMTYAEAARAIGAHEHDIVNARVRGMKRMQERMGLKAG